MRSEESEVLYQLFLSEFARLVRHRISRFHSQHGPDFEFLNRFVVIVFPGAETHDELRECARAKDEFDEFITTAIKAVRIAFDGIELDSMHRITYVLSFWTPFEDDGHDDYFHFCINADGMEVHGDAWDFLRSVSSPKLEKLLAAVQGELSFGTLRE